MAFWSSLPVPFFALAPLEGVTDTVFRRVVASCAKPDVFFTEFTSADGFCSQGRLRVEENFRFTPEETPIVAQIWGKNPDTLYETARELSRRGFAGIDINMGCPDRTVVASGCGAAMIDTPEIAARAIEAIKNGIRDSGNFLPVSVKTRLGNRTDVSDTWIPFLLDQHIDALTVHARTAKELSKVPARWESVRSAVEIRNRMRVPTVIIGNGDVKDARDAVQKHRSYGAEGIMIGRGVFADLWAFDRTDPPHRGAPSEYIDVLERHVRLFESEWGDGKNYATLKKFYKIYVQGFYGATEWRVRFMDSQSYEEVYRLIAELRESGQLRTIAV